MHISKFKIINYKSFLETEEIQLFNGINIITGKNNAGKTALLQTLSLNFVSVPHRSTKTLPVRDSAINQSSQIIVEFETSLTELKVFLSRYSQGINLAVPGLLENVDYNSFETNSFFQAYFEDIIVIKAHFQDNNLLKSEFKFVTPLNKEQGINLFLNTTTNKLSLYGIVNNPIPDFSNNIVSQFFSQFYSFKAERLNICNSPFGPNSILNSDASNLPEVLNILQGDSVRFERYNNYLRRIFPLIYQVSLRPNNAGLLQIEIWNEHPNLERSDLTIPLSDCGTGVSQVLAILYVIITADVPKVIIIDEPNSFLHPGASRKLIGILKEHPQHQYIISTHSPATIAASNPKTINIVKSVNAQSTVETIDVNDTNNQQLYLAEIGSKLSDVFGADNVLWVEGKTEELCFPKIIEKMNTVSLMGTVILSVINTGDFAHKKNADLIFKIYTKLSTGKGLLPPALGFFFDSEGLSNKEKDDFQRKGNGKVYFTKRRMFENYLLNSNAIFIVINSIVEMKEFSIKIEDITDWIKLNKWDKKFISQTYVNKGSSEEDWITNVDGAKFLDALFSDISNKKLSFDKIKHSVAICEWLIENSLEELNDISDMLSNFLSPKLSKKD